MPERLYTFKDECCGCTACYASCPVNAIKMNTDNKGFFYPVVNQELCIDCDECKRVCPFKNSVAEKEPLHIYAAKNKNLETRLHSSSGGSFALIAQWVEAQKGVIFGVAFDDNFIVKHMKGERRKDWQRFCGSKYVESDLGDTFVRIKKVLKTGRKVLFSGTPCQVAGLTRSLHGADISNLITCDLVCHGTPSPKVWKEFLDYLKKRFKTKIKKISFRDKEKTGWHNSTLTVWGKSDEILIKETQREGFFFQVFFRHLILKPACFKCPYSNFFRPGDITLGDYWGVEDHFQEFDDDKGISLVMCNTEKGKAVWEEINHDMDYFEVQKNQCLQTNLQQPSNYPGKRKRDDFWNRYNKFGLKYTGQRMGLLPKTAVDRVIVFAGRCVEFVCRKMRRIFYRSTLE
nr:Coenzyme F420 hydrogenase/dehydrogenase, beta subunit C-terminal domain [uncultured Desulfobacter sp.]